MSKNESNSQLASVGFRPLIERNKSLTCQRTKAIHNPSVSNHVELLSGTNLLHVKERKQFTTKIHCNIKRRLAEQISYMSKNESNSQPTSAAIDRCAERNKSLTCQRTKAIHNIDLREYKNNLSGTNLLHVKERKQFTTSKVIASSLAAAEQISYMSKNESNSQLLNALYPVAYKRNKSLTCQRTKAIHNSVICDVNRYRSGTNLLHVKERKQFTTNSSS